MWIVMNGVFLGNIMRFEGGLFIIMFLGGLVLICLGSVG